MWGKKIYILPGGDPDAQLSECDQRSGVHFLHSFPRPSVQGNQLSVCDCAKSCWFLGLRHTGPITAGGDMSRRMMLKSLRLFSAEREILDLVWRNARTNHNTVGIAILKGGLDDMHSFISWITWRQFETMWIGTKRKIGTMHKHPLFCCCLQVYMVLRPHVREFLQSMAKIYEVCFKRCLVDFTKLQWHIAHTTLRVPQILPSNQLYFPSLFICLCASKQMVPPVIFSRCPDPTGVVCVWTQLLFVFCYSCLFTRVQRRNMLRRYWTSWTLRGNSFGMSPQELLPRVSPAQMSSLSDLSYLACGWHQDADLGTLLGNVKWSVCGPTIT